MGTPGGPDVFFRRNCGASEFVLFNSLQNKEIYQTNMGK
jgi:hypothetical protein